MKPRTPKPRPDTISAAEIADQRLIHLGFAFGGLAQVSDHHVGAAIYGVLSADRPDLPPAARVIRAAARQLSANWEGVPGYTDLAEIADRIRAGYEMEHSLRHRAPPEGVGAMTGGAPLEILTSPWSGDGLPPDAMGGTQIGVCGGRAVYRRLDGVYEVWPPIILAWRVP